MIRSIIAAAAISAALAGCAGTQLAPPGMPTVAAIEAQQASLAGVTDVGGFYRTGLFLAQSACGAYFDQAVMLALRQAQTAGEEQLLSGLATGLMGLAGAGGQAVGATGLVSGTIGNMLGTAQSDSLAGSDPAATSTLVATAQGQIIAAMANPTTAADAMADLYAVYRTCSPSGIRGMEEQAIMAAPAHLSVTGGPTAPVAPTTPAFARRAVMRPSAALPMVSVH